MASTLHSHFAVQTAPTLRRQPIRAWSSSIQRGVSTHTCPARTLISSTHDSLSSQNHGHADATARYWASAARSVPSPSAELPSSPCDPPTLTPCDIRRRQSRLPAPHPTSLGARLEPVVTLGPTGGLEMGRTPWLPTPDPFVKLCTSASRTGSARAVIGLSIFRLVAMQSGRRQPSSQHNRASPRLQQRSARSPIQILELPLRPALGREACWAQVAWFLCLAGNP